MFLWACKTPLHLYMLYGSQGIFISIFSIEVYNIKYLHNTYYTYTN